jgi:hypothetical protein
MERIFGIAFSLKDKKFQKMTPQVVGKVLADGTIEGTDYSFGDGGKTIKGGVAYTTNSTLVEDDGDMVNPATKERFEPTKKGTGYWNPVSKTWIKCLNKK